MPQNQTDPPHKRREKVRYYDDPVLLGRRLRKAREAAGLSQRELSFPGCTAAYISRIEKGERVPSLQLIREFAARLGVSADYLLTGQKTPQDFTDKALWILRTFGYASADDLRKVFGTDVPKYKHYRLAWLVKHLLLRPPRELQQFSRRLHQLQTAKSQPEP